MSLLLLLTGSSADNVPVSILNVRPPLELHAELVAPDGTRYRWAGDRTSPGDIPSGIGFASKRFEGWERGSCRLNRPIDRDWPDLGLFDGFNLIGYDGSTAYEGELGQVPRSTPFGIGVETTGFMADARKQKFRENYVSRDNGLWHEPKLWRQAELALAGNKQTRISASTGQEGLVFEAPNEALTANEVKELWWESPPGMKAGVFQYRGATTGSFTGFEAATVYSTDSTAAASSYDSNGLTLDDTLRTVSLATGRRALVVRLLTTGAVTPAAGTQVRYTAAAVHGTHGLTKRTVASGEPDGYYASDIIKDICSRFCPRLSTAGVLDTTWPIPQAAWLDRTDPYDAWLELNKYHLWELEVWEGRTLHYHPSDLTDYDWEVRTTDPGVSVELQGDSTDHLANYAVVQFTNSRTGEQDEVSPDTHSELRDVSVENPTNRHGLDVEFGISLSDPVDPDSAAQIGRAALAENNQPRAIGTITFRGHIRDRAGHWQQGWKVRAGETVVITDWPNNRPRLIGECEWSQDTKTGQIAVDSTLRRVDAFLDRFGTALRAANLAS